MVNPLVKSKWLWLRSPEKLTDKQRALFAALQLIAILFFLGKLDMNPQKTV